MSDRYRHRKRGSTYVERDRGELQLATDRVLKEGDRLVSYRGEDGRTWFRYEPEFDDGRFERLPDAVLEPYGHCPHCGAPGRRRERRPNGNDTCERGHTYPSRDAIKRDGLGEYRAALVGDDIDIALFRAAYRADGPNTGTDRLIDALEAARAETAFQHANRDNAVGIIGRLKSEIARLTNRRANAERRLHNALDAIDGLHAEIAGLKSAASTVPALSHYSRDELRGMQARLSIHGGGCTEAERKFLSAIDAELAQRG